MPVQEEISILYDGEVKIHFDPIKHIYRVDDEIIYGVTSIIAVLAKPALLYWAVNQGVAYLEANLKPGVALDELQIKDLADGVKYAHKSGSRKAADIGTLVHDWIEKWVLAKINKQPLPDLPKNPQMKFAVDAFLKWESENKVVFKEAEKKVYSRKYKFAGTLDLEAVVNGELGVIDIKTSSGIYPDMFMQISSYIKARTEETGNKYKEGWILRVPKDGSDFEAKKTTKVEEHYRAFLACLEIYKWQMARKAESIVKI